MTEAGGSLPFCPLAFYALALRWHIYEESRKGCHLVNTAGKFRVRYSGVCWNSKVCSINCRKQRALKHKINGVVFFLLFIYRGCHPLANEPVGTWCIFLLHFLPLCRASLPCYHISPLCSILLLAQQRQVANFLPFNLQQFPCSRRTHTREEEPRLPWVNWARGLAKRHWWEVKVF